MCGIAGAIHLDHNAVERAVRRMMRAMMHRGPDDEGYAELPLSGHGGGAACGLGFRRLAVMDLTPAGRQPMVNHDTGDVLVFNGEIYNFRSLRKTLEDCGHVFHSTGDAEVLLHAFSEWGEAALHRLDGMFAVAFYHAASRRVLLARDPLGIKPLYVSRTKTAIVFASEVRALLASGLVSADLDPAGIASFLAYGAPQDPLTIHRGIRSFPPAHYEWIDVRDIETSRAAATRYWTFPALAAVHDEAVVVNAIREKLQHAVWLQCTADVPLGVFLSGGIDSATIAALASHGSRAMHTFSVGYDVPGVTDETGEATATAAFLGTHHFQTIVDDDWVVLQLSEWLKAADRPSIDGLNTYIVSGAVKDRGITVALSGLGADELFGGYGTFRTVPKVQRLMRLAAWLPAGMRRLAARLVFSVLPAGKREKAVDLVSSGTSAVELASLARRVLSDASLQQLGLDSSLVGLTRSYLPTEAFDSLSNLSEDSFQAVAQAEATLYMGNTLLRDTDTNSMAHSLEIRVPFLGQSLVDYVSSLPGAARAPRGSQPKHLLRRAMADTLPKAVFEKPKSGFSLPFRQWLMGPLRQQSEAAVEGVFECPVIDSVAARKAWRRYSAPESRVHWSRAMAFVSLGHYLRSVAR